MKKNVKLIGSLFLVLVVFLSVSNMRGVYADEQIDTEDVEQEQTEIYESKDEMESSEDVGEKEAASSSAVMPVNVDVFADETTYTVNDLFGDGNYDFMKNAINSSLGLSDVDRWTAEQLDSIGSLNIANVHTSIFPNDLSAFRKMQHLYISNVSGLETLSFQYVNSQTVLSNIDISEMPDLKKISGIKVDVQEEYSTFTLNNIPNIEVVENVEIPKLYHLVLELKNLEGDMMQEVEANSQRSVSHVDGKPNEVENELLENKSYEEITALSSKQAMTLSNMKLDNVKSLTVTMAHIDSIPTFNNNFRNTYIGNSLIRNIEAQQTQTLPVDPTFYLHISTSTIGRVGDIVIDWDENTVSSNINLVGVTIGEMGSVQTKGVSLYYGVSASRIDKLGTIRFMNENEADEGYENISINTYGNYIKNFEGVAIKGMHNGFNVNVGLSISVFDNIGEMSFENTNVDVYYPHVSLSFYNIHAKKIGNFKLNLFDQLVEQGSFNYTNMYNVIEEVGNITSNAHSNQLSFGESTIDTLGDIDLTAQHTSIYFDASAVGGVSNFGNINVRKRPVAPDLGMDSIRIFISSTRNIESIGNILLETSDKVEDVTLTFSQNIETPFTIEKIGSISSNQMKELTIDGFQVKKLGELNLPNAEKINLDGNQLTHLFVKDGLLPSVNVFSAVGNQIAGSLPIPRNSRDASTYEKNFFDVNDGVEDQSYLYLDIDGTQYKDEKVYEIDLAAGEELHIDDLIDYVRMHDGVDDPSDTTRLFPHHTWKYAVTRQKRTVNWIPAESGAKVAGLEGGENELVLSLSGAAAENDNAKIRIIVNKEETATVPETPNPTAPMPGETTSDSGQTVGGTSTNTGDSTNQMGLFILLLSSMMLASYLVAKNQK